jgi:hypothetical protein
MTLRRSHTSKWCYSNGCRKPECRERWNEHMAEYRKKNRDRLNAYQRDRREARRPAE